MAVRFRVQHDSRCIACLFIGELVDLESVRMGGVCGVSQRIVIHDHAAVGLVLLAVSIQEPHDAAAGSSFGVPFLYLIINLAPFGRTSSMRLGSADCCFD